VFRNSLLNRTSLLGIALLYVPMIYLFTNPNVPHTGEFLLYTKYLIGPGMIASIYWGYFMVSVIYVKVDSSSMFYYAKSTDYFREKSILWYLKVITGFTILHSIFLFFFICYYSYLFHFSYELMISIIEIYGNYYYIPFFIGLLIGMFSADISYRKNRTLGILYGLMFCTPLIISLLIEWKRPFYDLFIMNSQPYYPILSGSLQTDDSLLFKAPCLVGVIILWFVFSRIKQTKIFVVAMFIGLFAMSVGVERLYANVFQMTKQAFYFEQYIHLNTVLLEQKNTLYSKEEEQQIGIEKLEVSQLPDQRIAFKTTLLVPVANQNRFFLNTLFDLKRVTTNNRDLDFERQGNQIVLKDVVQGKITFEYIAQNGDGLTPIQDGNIYLPYHFNWYPTLTAPVDYLLNENNQPTLNRFNGECQKNSITVESTLSNLQSIDSTSCPTLIIGKYNTKTVGHYTVHMPIIWSATSDEINYYLNQVEQFHRIQLESQHFSKVNKVVVVPKFELDVPNSVDDFWINGDTLYMMITPFQNVNSLGLFKGITEESLQSIAYQYFLQQGLDANEAMGRATEQVHHFLKLYK